MKDNMTTLTGLLSSPAALDLGWALLHFLWQGAVLAGLCGVTWHLLRPQPPNSRYLVGCFFLLMMASAPMITYSTLATRREWSEAGGRNAGKVTSPAAKTGQPGAWPREKILSWLVGFWLVGVIILSNRLLLGWASVRRLKRNQVWVLDSSWQEKLPALKRGLGLRRMVGLFQSALVEVPTVVGWLRPVILLPASSLTGLTTGQLEAVLAHELAHIRRHDYLINWLQSLLETLLFYHPAVWWISQRVREERENCCDDVAVAWCGNRVDYAQALATLEELRPAPVRWALGAGGGNLLHRVRRLLGLSADQPRTNWDRRNGRVSAAVAASLVAGFLVLRLATAAAPSEPAAVEPSEPSEPAAEAKSTERLAKQIERQARAIAGSAQNSTAVAEKDLQALNDSANELAKSVTESALKRVEANLKKLERAEIFGQQDLKALQESARSMAKSAAELARRQAEANLGQLEANLGKLEANLGRLQEAREISAEALERSLQTLGEKLAQSANQIVVAAAAKAAPAEEFEEVAKGAEGTNAVLTKSFPVTPGGQLVMEVDRGPIEVASGEGSQVEVVVTRRIKGGTGAAAGEVLAAHQIDFAHEGNKVELHAQFPKGAKVSDRDKSRLQAEYKIVVPKKFNLDLKTAGGHIQIGDLEGEVKAVTAGGALKFGNIQGPVQGRTSGGEITLASASSTVNVNTAGGRIELGELRGETTAKTAGGSIKVDKCKAKLLAETSGGEISVRRALNTVKAKTAGGSISVTFSAQPDEDCALNTAAGNIRVKVSPDLSFDINAKTSGGRVITDLDLTPSGPRKASSVRGTLNKGGKALVLSTSGGNIFIDKL